MTTDTAPRKLTDSEIDQIAAHLRRWFRMEGADVDRSRVAALCAQAKLANIPANAAPDIAQEIDDVALTLAKHISHDEDYSSAARMLADEIVRLSDSRPASKGVDEPNYSYRATMEYAREMGLATDIPDAAIPVATDLEKCEHDRWMNQVCFQCNRMVPGPAAATGLATPAKEGTPK